MQLQGRVIGNDAARAQPRRRQEAVNGPATRVRVLGHRREDLAGDAPDVARLEMLGKHCRHDPVARLAADGGGVLGPAEDGMRAEERRRDEPGHGNLPRYFVKVFHNHI